MNAFLVVYAANAQGFSAMRDGLTKAFTTCHVPLREGVCIISYGGHAQSLEREIIALLGPLPFLVIVRAGDDYSLKFPPAYSDAQRLAESFFPAHRSIE